VARPIVSRGLVLVVGVVLALSPRYSSASAQDSEPHRLLLEAEHFQGDGSGWQPIEVGQGNYFVDAIGAGHYSGGRMLRLPSSEGPAATQTDVQIPETGTYRVWSRYDFPWRDAAASFRIQIRQRNEIVFDVCYGEPNARRMWFFNLPDAPWHDLQYGVEGPVSEAHDVSLQAGPATVVLLGEQLDQPSADRIVDFVFLTSDLGDEFRRRGERLYPILDEIGRGSERLFVRVINPDDTAAELRMEAQYTFNRAPWRSPAVQLGARGAGRDNSPEVLPPGTSTPWMNLSCQDTTHACHLHFRTRSPLTATPTVELSSEPSEVGLIRRLALTSSELIVSVPAYPAREPLGIQTIDESLRSIVESLESTTPPGRPPTRFPVYAGLGDNVERRLDGPDETASLYRRLFFLTGANAFNNLNLSALPAELAAASAEGMSLGRFHTYGDYRWFPTPERIDKAQRDIAEAEAEPFVRAFTLGDEIKLSDWYPRGNDGDQLFREAMQAIGETPEALGVQDWSSLRLDAAVRMASSNPRLFVRAHRFQDEYALGQLRAGVQRIRDAFGPEVLIGANFSPHPDFRPDVPSFVKAFREAGLTLASHSDYWWQDSEMGPESTGFVLDAFRAGLRGRSGVLQPYVMPHSPGNTDRDFMLGLWTALIHGARAVDLFRVGPEQINTENYISSHDPGRYQTIREALRLLGPAEDTLLDGAPRQSSVALVLSQSTDLWESVTAARDPGIPSDTKLTSQASNTERKGLWQALRHSHIPVNMITEDDLASGSVEQYRVIYFAGPWLSSSAAMGLARWIEAGGTLVASAGAGTLDEFSSPTGILSSAQGIDRRSLNISETFLRPRIEVPRLRPIGRVSMIANPSISFDAVAWRDSFVTNASVELLAQFDDGSPALAVHRLGLGRAITFGTLPGVAYLRSGFPQPPPLPDRGPFMHQPLTAYDPTLRELISQWAAAATPSRPSTSDPLVDVGLAETPSQMILPLANFGDQPATVEVSVPDAGGVLTVSSVQHGALPFSLEGSTLRIQVPINVIDMLVVDRLEQ
jgi:hypothetical protein